MCARAHMCLCSGELLHWWIHRHPGCTLNDTLCGFIRFTIVVFLNCCLFLFIKEKFDQLDQIASFCILYTETLENYLYWISLYCEGRTYKRHLFYVKFWLCRPATLFGVSEQPVVALVSDAWLCKRRGTLCTLPSVRVCNFGFKIMYTYTLYIYVCMYENMKLVCQKMCVFSILA